MDKITHNTTMRLRVRKLLGNLIHKTTKVSRKTGIPALTLQTFPSGILDIRVTDTDGGHLMALSLGGPDRAENIVPMFCGCNRKGGDWRKMEEEIEKIVAKQSGLRLSIEIEYYSDDRRIPQWFKVQLLNASDSSLYQDMGIKWNYLDPAAQMELEANSVKLIAECQKELDTSGWKLEQYVQKTGGPSLNLPGNGIARPYAVLDYMMYVKDFQDLKCDTIGNGRGFTGNQRNNILLVNRVRNDRWLKSDDAADTKNALSLRGDGGAEIDHIVPKKGQGGCNAYSNAQVISSMRNKAKGMTSNMITS